MSNDDTVFQTARTYKYWVWYNFLAAFVLAIIALQLPPGLTRQNVAGTVPIILALSLFGQPASALIFLATLALVVVSGLDVLGRCLGAIDYTKQMNIFRGSLYYLLAQLPLLICTAWLDVSTRESESRR